MKIKLGALIIILTIFAVDNCKTKEEKLEILKEELKQSILSSDLKDFEKLLKKFKSDYNGDFDRIWVGASDVNGKAFVYLLKNNKEEFIKKYIEIYQTKPNFLYSYVRDEAGINLVNKLGGNMEVAFKEGVNPLNALLEDNPDKPLLESIYKKNPQFYTRYKTKNGTDTTSTEFIIACFSIEKNGFAVFYPKKLVNHQTLAVAAYSNCTDNAIYLPFIGIDAKNEEGYYLYVNRAIMDMEFLKKLNPEDKTKLVNLENKDGNNMLLFYLSTITGEYPSNTLVPEILESVLLSTENFLIRNHKDKGIMDYAYELCTHNDMESSGSNSPNCIAKNTIEKAYDKALSKVYEDALIGAKNGDLTVIESLKEKKIRLDNVKAANGQTLLMEAVIYNQLQFAEKLLEDHVNTATSRNDGNKAIDLARAGNNKEMEDLLTKFGGAK